MVTKLTVPAEPLLIGSRSVLCKFFAMPRQQGDPRRIEGTMTIVGSEAALTLDMLVGPQGNPGEPSPIIRPQWGSSVTEVGDLPALATLEEADEGRAWYIDGEWHIYDNGAYHTVSGSIPGPPGATPDISVTAEQIEAEDPVVYGAIEVVETGTSLAPNFHIKIPGVPGPEGPAGVVKGAVDVDDTDFGAGRILAVIDADPPMHGYVDPFPRSVEKYTIPHANFVDYNGSAGRQLIASLNIPAKDFDWYPDVTGHVRLQRSIFSSASYEVEVRIGNTGVGTGENEPLCGLAPYDPSWALLDAIAIAYIGPHFSDTGDPVRAVSPDTLTARVLAGEAKTIYVFLHKVGGSGTIEFTKDRAQLRINVEPAGSS
jgi:hypothetical protein